MIEAKIEIDGKFSLDVKKIQNGMIEVQVVYMNEYITFVVSSEDFVKLRVLGSSKKFLDVGLRF